ncbi:DoxX family protein [Occallatibacter riparius]|uniref:DoxX family protein n=1 Tax=Occallatibacter riparius TaxID=1002689 RepID=A0A9J7BWR0_9BACT|nr:DoxX family protein [Occallatibacter riparius]UWZ85469.1 DoxX family protein [Occallatibacter riparius]
MSRSQQPAITLFALGMIGLGALALIVGDFAMQWQPVAPWFPARTALAYAAGLLMFVCGAGLLFRPTAAWSARILFPYCILWALLKVPALIVAPSMEAVWLGFGEITVLLSGAWTLFVRLADLPESSPLAPLTSERSLTAARILFALSLLPIGLSHIVYIQPTHDFVPAWLPFRTFWAYLTGLGQMASGLGILFGVFPRISAWAEAIQISLYTLLIWVPSVIIAPSVRLKWTGLLISWIIAAAAWAVAQNVPTPAQTPETEATHLRQKVRVVAR